MKRNLLVLAVMVVAVLFFTSHNAGAQCLEDLNDLGDCDTLYVETFDCDHEYNANPGSFDSVRVAIYVTHDSNTFWWEVGYKWVQDSIAAFSIPLTFWHQPPGCADSVIFPTWDNWNNKCINPDHPDSMNRSMFRHIVDTHTGDTTYNRMLQMVENFWDPWEVHTNIESHSSDGDSGHVFLSLLSDWDSQRWWEGSRVLLVTLTFHVYMSEDCDTTEIGIDSTFWPPTNPLAFSRYDGHNYIPRHFLPVKDTIHEPFEPDTCSDGISQWESTILVACRLEVEYTGTGGTLRDVVVIQNPPGCPDPEIQVTGGNTIHMDWGQPCVDFLEDVHYQFTVDYPCEVVQPPSSVTWIFCEAPLETLAYYGPPRYAFTIPDAYEDDFFNMRFIMPDAYGGRLDQIHICFYQPASAGTPDPYIWVWNSTGTYPDDDNPPLGSIYGQGIGHSSIVWYPDWTIFHTEDAGLEFNPGEMFHIGYSHDKNPGDTLAIVSDSATGTGVEQSSEWYYDHWGTMLEDWGRDYNFFIRAVICPYRPYICGDCNGDSAVDIGDASWIINYLFAASPAPDPLCIGDANCDGIMADIGDASYLINWLFAGGPSACLECCDFKAKTEEFPDQKMERILPQKRPVPQKLPKVPGDLKQIE